MNPTIGKVTMRPASLIAVMALSLAWVSEARAARETCEDCHSYMSRRSQQIVAQWKQSIHGKRGIGCSACHGGDPTDPTMDGSMRKVPSFVGIPAKRDIPALCAKCHANPAYMRPFNISSTSQYAEYRQSVHGKRLEQGDRKVAACTDCHGTHDIRPRDDVKSLVYKTNIPKTCAKCHSDVEYMRGYGIPTNQYEEYRKSWHGHKLLEEQDRAAPACADCHGTHGATPPGVKEVPKVCGTCHARTQDYFNEGPHGAALLAGGEPRCVSCHGNHAIVKPSDVMLVGSRPGHCGDCHARDSAAYGNATALHRMIRQLEQRYKGATRALERAEHANMDMQDQFVELEKARTNLIAARAIQHTVDPRKVKEVTDSAAATVKSVDAAASLALDRSHRRSIALLALGLLIVFTSLVLYWKWRLAFERWRTRTGPA